MMSDANAPDRIWAWCFNSGNHGGWAEWGGYARPGNRFPMDSRERETGAEYVRADLADAPAAALDEIEELRRRCEIAEATLAGQETMREALEAIAGIGFDAPATWAGTDAEWERKRANEMQRISRAALKEEGET